MGRPKRKVADSASTNDVVPPMKGGPFHQTETAEKRAKRNGAEIDKSATPVPTVDKRVPLPDLQVPLVTIGNGDVDYLDGDEMNKANGYRSMIDKFLHVARSAMQTNLEVAERKAKNQLTADAAKAELSQILSTLQTDLIGSLNGQLNACRRQIDHHHAQLDLTIQHLQTSEENLKLSNTLVDKANLLVQQLPESNRLKAERDQLQLELQSAEEKLKLSDAKVVSLQKDVARGLQNVAKSEETNAALTAQNLDLLDKLNELRRQLNESQSGRSGLQSKLTVAEKKLQLSKNLVDKANQLVQQLAERDNIQLRLQSAEESLKETDKKVNESEANRDKIQFKLQSAKIDIDWSQFYEMQLKWSQSDVEWWRKISAVKREEILTLRGYLQSCKDAIQLTVDKLKSLLTSFSEVGKNQV